MSLEIVWETCVSVVLHVHDRVWATPDDDVAIEDFVEDSDVLKRAIPDKLEALTCSELIAM